MCLPCKHEGGDLVLSYHGVTNEVSTSTTNPMFIAQYLDTTQEMREVRSGYRLALTYNLTLPGLCLEPSASPDYINPPLDQSVKQWLRSVPEDSGATTELIYKVEHKYTDAMGTWALKTNDLSRTNALIALTKIYPIVVYFAIMEYEVYGSVEDYCQKYKRHQAITEICSESLSLK